MINTSIASCTSSPDRSIAPFEDNSFDVGDSDLHAQIQEAMRDHGITPPNQIIIDGTFHRFSTNANPKDTAGWYVFFDDGIPAGVFGDWRTDAKFTWRVDIGREFSRQELKQIERQQKEAQQIRENELAKQYQKASIKAAKIWEEAKPATSHPYLKKKGIKPHLARISKSGNLILPVYGGDGKLSSIQTIDRNGKKQFLKGGKMAGGYCILGDLQKTGKVYLAEGFATAASIYEVTGTQTIVAYNAGNLKKVAKLFYSDPPKLELIIVADNDKNGVGQKAAEDAAKETDARVIIPSEPGDANDFVQNGGDLAALLSPAKNNWLIWADDFSSQAAPIKWLIKHWIQDNAMIMVHGPSGAGKSFVVLDWCMRIASSIDSWAGNVVRHGTVVYLAGEGHHGLRGRIAVWKQYHNINNLDMMLSSSGTNLDTPAGLQKVLTNIREASITPKIVVVDTLHRFLAGNENETVDTKRMLDSCSTIMREFFCSVLLVHHTGFSPEAKKRGRGSSSWKGPLDNEISIIQKSGKIEIDAVKMKETEVPQPLWCTLDPVAIDGWIDEDGESATSAVPVLIDKPTESKGTQKNIKELSKAWYFSGAEDIDGTPFITRLAWKEYMVTNLGKSKSAAKQAVKSSDKGIAGRLLKSGIIQDFKAGYLIIDNELASVLMVSKAGRKVEKR